MKYMVIVFIAIFMTAGCQKDMPEPETVSVNTTTSKGENLQVMPASALFANAGFYVKHDVRGNDIYLECQLDGISFRDGSTQKKGKILLTIDRERKVEVTNAAFIVKDLSPGLHRFALEVVKPNNEPYGLKEQFTLTISE